MQPNNHKKQPHLTTNNTNVKITFKPFSNISLNPTKTLFKIPTVSGATVSDNNCNTPKFRLHYTRKRKYKEQNLALGSEDDAVVEMPAPGGRKVVVGEVVEVYYEEEWRKGIVLRVLSEGLRRYLVRVHLDDHGHHFVEVPVQVCGSHLVALRISDSGSLVPLPLPAALRESFQTKVKGDGGHLMMEREYRSNSNSRSRTMAEITANDHSKRLKLRIKSPKIKFETKFRSGTTVEVKGHEDGFHGSWYTATVVGSAGVAKFLVEYHTLKTEDDTALVKEILKEQNIRPCPPHIPQIGRYKVLEEVDVWDNEGWWEGVVLEVLDDWNYLVDFASTNEKLVYGHSNLRHHQNWIDGEWILSSGPSQASGGDQSAKELLKIDLTEGTAVEVRSDEDGFRGSWYTATIIGITAKDKLLVEYDNLKTIDNKYPLREEVFASDIRPSPPVLRVSCYKRFEEVDAWMDSGWWVGVISEVLRQKYVVYFASTGNSGEFDHVTLRPHQEWIGGKWIMYKQKQSDLKVRTPSAGRKQYPSISGRNFDRDTRVEVRTDEPGYEGSWYSAVIVGSKRPGSFVVEYMTLKAENGKYFLREEVDAKNIRPFPPAVKASERRSQNETVDAWYNDGWWVGVISRVLGSGKYMVYFKTTGEELEFDSADLRTHQVWIGGEWIAANKDCLFKYRK